MKNENTNTAKILMTEIQFHSLSYQVKSCVEVAAKLSHLNKKIIGFIQNDPASSIQLTNAARVLTTELYIRELDILSNLLTMWGITDNKEGSIIWVIESIAKGDSDLIDQYIEQITLQKVVCSLPAIDDLLLQFFQLL